MGKGLRSKSLKRNKDCQRNKIYKQVEHERLLKVVEHEKNRHMEVADAGDFTDKSSKFRAMELIAEESANSTDRVRTKKNLKKREKTFHPYGISKKELKF